MEYAKEILLKGELEMEGRKWERERETKKNWQGKDRHTERAKREGEEVAQNQSRK